MLAFGDADAALVAPYQARPPHRLLKSPPDGQAPRGSRLQSTNRTWTRAGSLFQNGFLAPAATIRSARRWFRWSPTRRVSSGLWFVIQPSGWLCGTSHLYSTIWLN